jgi:hypothetical protein
MNYLVAPPVLKTLFTVVGFTDLSNWQLSLSVHYMIVHKI